MHFLVQTRKNKKIHPKKTSYTPGKWNFLILTLKNSYISGNRNTEKILYISDRTSKTQKTKVSYISPKKIMNNFF